MSDLVGAAIGLVFAGTTIFVARTKNYENWLYIAFLPCLPLFYMAFGVLDGSVDSVVLELVFGLPFIAAGLLLIFLKFRFSAYLAGACWLAHAGWDVEHDLFFINPGVWSWYPAFCAVIDGVIGIYLFFLGTVLPQGRIDLATVRPH